jgi:ATP-dependent helicase/nuclease subunit A
LKRKTPSKDPASGPRVAPWFVAATLRAREFGTAVHAVFQQIEWLTPGEPWDPDKLPSALKASISSEAIAHVAHCLEQPDIRSIFERRGASEEVWRETAFEVILDGEWVSGTFDRVNLLRDDEGRVCSVIVIDFKSGANFVGEDPDQLAIRYGHQVDLYRRSAALLTGVPVKDVEVCLVFTAQPRRVDVASRQNGRKSSQARKRRSL